jgi:hypothetical protein
MGLVRVAESASEYHGSIVNHGYRAHDFVFFEINFLMFLYSPFAFSKSSLNNHCSLLASFVQVCTSNCYPARYEAFSGSSPIRRMRIEHKSLSNKVL